MLQSHQSSRGWPAAPSQEKCDVPALKAAAVWCLGNHQAEHRELYKNWFLLLRGLANIMGSQQVYEIPQWEWMGMGPPNQVFCEGWTPVAVEIRRVFCGIISPERDKRQGRGHGCHVVFQSWCSNTFNGIMLDSEVILLRGTAICGWSFMRIVCTVNALCGNSFIFFE